MANYPWDCSIDAGHYYAGTPDDDTFVYLATLYADTHLTMHDSKVTLELEYLN